MDSEAALKTTDANLEISTQKVSQSGFVRHFFDLGKIILSHLIVPHVRKILQNLWLCLVFTHSWRKEEGCLQNFEMEVQATSIIYCMFLNRFNLQSISWIWSVSSSLTCVSFRETCELSLIVN